MLLFITCDRHGKRITDESALMTVKYDIWICPESGASNPPLNNKEPDSFDATEGGESKVRIKATEKIISILWGEVRQLRQIGGQQVEAAYCARRKLLRVKQGEMLASHCVKYCEEAHGSHYDILAIIVFSTGCRSLLCGVQRLCLAVSDLAF